MLNIDIKAGNIPINKAFLFFLTSIFLKIKKAITVTIAVSKPVLVIV